MDGEKITQFGHSNVSRALPLHSKPVFCFSNQINPLSASLILRNYKFEEQEIVASPIKDKNERITVETISQLIIENTTDNTHIEIKEEIKTTKIIEERQDEFTDRKKLSKTENRTKKSPIDITFTHPLATFADTTENLPKKGFFANNDSYLEGMDDIEEVDELELDDLDEIIDVNQINEPEEKEDKKEVSEDENITSNTSFDSKAALEVDIFGFYIQKSKELGIINKCPSSYDPNHEKVLIRTWDHWISLQSNSFQTSSNTPQKSTNTSSDWMISDTFILDLVKTHAIPHSIRPKVWKYLAASSKDQTTETRRRLLTCTEEGSDGQKIYNDLLSRGPVNECSNQIKLDIFRTFSSHSLYVEENGNGQQRLFNVLLAYSYWNPHIGYCQGMSFVGAALLMFMSEVETFWLLDWMFSEKRSGDYYIHSMKGILNDSQLLDSLIRLVYPLLHSHLSGQGIHPLMYSTPWFMTIFTHLPSWYTILRIFDYFFIEGPAAILRFSLAILHVCQESLLDIEKLDLILPLLQNISIDKCKEEVLLPIARSIPIHHYIRHHKSLQPPTPQQQTAPVTRSTSQKQLRTSTGNSNNNHINNHSNNNNAIVQSSTKVPPPKQSQSIFEKFWTSFSTPSKPKIIINSNNNSPFVNQSNNNNNQNSNKVNSVVIKNNVNNNARNNNINNNNSAKKRKIGENEKNVLVYELTPIKSPKKQKTDHSEEEDDEYYSSQSEDQYNSDSSLKSFKHIKSSSENYENLSPISKEVFSPKHRIRCNNNKSPRSPIKRSPHSPLKRSPLKTRSPKSPLKSSHLKLRTTQRTFSATKVGRNSPLPEQ